MWLAVCFILLEEACEGAPAAQAAAAAPALPSGHLSRVPQSRPAAEQQALLLTAIRVADAQDVQETELLVSPGRQPPHASARMMLAEANFYLLKYSSREASEYLGSWKFSLCTDRMCSVT